MQYNYPHFRIDRTDFLKGGTSYPDYPDGGMDFSTSGYNAFYKPGYLGNMDKLIFPVSNIVSPPIGIGMNIAKGKGVASQVVMAVGNNTSRDGFFYQVSPSTGVLTGVGVPDTTQDYVQGSSSTVFYNGSFYTTSQTDIVKNSYDLGTRDVSWWRTTSGRAILDAGSPHPQVVYGDIHYIADGQYLHQDDHGTIQSQVLNLGNDWVITEMCVYNNLIYIAAEPYYNFDASGFGLAKIFTWNGYSGSFLDEYQVSSRISAMYVFKNILYVWTKNYMGYFDGHKIKNIYPMRDQIYSSQITETSDSLWFCDNDISGTGCVVRYGSPYPLGQNHFHRTYQSGSVFMNGIATCQTEKMTIFVAGASNGSNYFFNSVNQLPSTGSTEVIFNRRKFLAPVKIRGYVINAFRPLSNNQGIQVRYIGDELGTVVNSTKIFVYGGTGMSGKSTWKFDVNSQKPTRTVQINVTISGNVLVDYIDVLYEPSETKLNA